ncbi:centromere kinetochore component CENP-T-domain-containing protein [Colletotrichum godetiae]|uniref:Centromere kinetochore component CENP-T-domain-containing protein n=1 Tax=Colletotrichum godetiae TaxID=1209918 RepID=A0AAJ0AHN6_9PEZI|nr:centromere kinetochore component CENP-T-domain-containing protein [Colletotrichum godetiae]KAK1672628.1 centromere kinetochore component CENP-T-domain-containing protein [Colletotrichum godetiae]
MSSSPTFTTPLNPRLAAVAGAEDDDPLFSSALDTVTPNRRALSLDPPSSRASLVPRTPSNNNPLRSSLRSSAGYRGLSASGRRSLAATPHARAAYRTIDQRRAAALTPGGNKRRESFRPRRESLHDVLRGLSRVVKHATQPISSSSSPSDFGSRGPSASLPIRTVGGGNRRGTVYDDDDDDDELPIDRPRLSLPLDVEDDDEDELVAPELSQIDENATIEFPRRAYVDQPSRMSMGSARLSGFRNYGDLDDDDDDDRGEGFFPAFEVGALDEEGREAEETLDRVEEEDLRRQTLASARDSDFGFEVPVDADNQTTFMMAVDGQSSPARPLPEITDEQPSLNIASVDDEPAAPMDEDLGFGTSYYDMRSSTPIEPTEATQGDLDGQTEVSAAQLLEQEQGQRPRKTKRGVKLSKYGVEYPSLPPAVVKRLANTFAKSSGISKTKIAPDALAEIQRASDWFFEQLGDDLSAYAKHAKRKTIDESDMLTLMRRYVLLFFHYANIASSNLGVSTIFWGASPFLYPQAFCSFGTNTMVSNILTDNVKLVRRRLPFLWHTDTCPGSCYRS